MNTYHDRGRPPYLLGLLGIIPLVGGFVGAGLILLGVIQYRDRKLVLIGLAGVLFNVFIYSSFFMYSNSTDRQKGFVTIAKDNLNGLAKSVEFYKVQYGAYPDSLDQVAGNGALIFDPVQKPKNDFSQKFHYQKKAITITFSHLVLMELLTPVMTFTRCRP